VTDPSRFFEWQRDVVRVEASPGPLSVGARFTTYRRIGGTERATIQEVTEASPAGSWAARGIDGPLRPHAMVTIESIDDGTGSRVTFSLDFEGHGVGIALLPLVRRLTRRGSPVSYRNLKRLLEARSEPG
jgi:hypothetical protein